MPQALKWKKKGALFFHIDSGKLETTLTLTFDQTRLYYTSFTEAFNIPVVMSYSPLFCGSACCHGYLFMKHSRSALIRTEPRDQAGKKNLTKLVSNNSYQ